MTDNTITEAVVGTLSRVEAAIAQNAPLVWEIEVSYAFVNALTYVAVAGLFALASIVGLSKLWKASKNWDEEDMIWGRGLLIFLTLVFILGVSSYVPDMIVPEHAAIETLLGALK